MKEGTFNMKTEKKKLVATKVKKSNVKTKFIAFYTKQIVKSLLLLMVATLPYSFTMEYANNVALQQNQNGSIQTLYVSDVQIQIFIIVSALFIVAAILKIVRMKWNYTKAVNSNE